MDLMRSALLMGSQSAWLGKQASRYRFVRKAVTRFMPGERLEDAMTAARMLQDRGISTLFTQLGENVTDAPAANAVAAHYVEAQDRVHEASLDSQISVKLTQLGLDLGIEPAFRNLKQIVDHAAALKTMVWIDMESTAYTDITLDIFRRMRAERANVGVCLQAYLRRTSADLETLWPLGPAIRLVKGAYREPPALAFAKRRDVDEHFFALAARLLGPDAAERGAFLGVGTHDPDLIRRIQEHASSTHVPKDAFEFEMLYGIKRDEQARLAAEGYRVRVLISYGEHWFPWYMRRLAERPANVLFVLKNVIGR